MLIFINDLTKGLIINMREREEGLSCSGGCSPENLISTVRNKRRRSAPSDTKLFAFLLPGLFAPAVRDASVGAALRTLLTSLLLAPPTPAVRAATVSATQRIVSTPMRRPLDNRRTVSALTPGVWRLLEAFFA